MADMSDEEAVANPLKAELRQLLEDTRTAVDLVPGLDAVATAVGDGDAWRGPLARRMHDDTFAPWATRVSQALTDLVDDVQDATDGQDDDVDPDTARRMRQELGL